MCFSTNMQWLHWIREKCGKMWSGTKVQQVFFKVDILVTQVKLITSLLSRVMGTMTLERNVADGFLKCHFVREKAEFLHTVNKFNRDATFQPQTFKKYEIHNKRRQRLYTKTTGCNNQSKGDT